MQLMGLSPPTTSAAATETPRTQDSRELSTHVMTLVEPSSALTTAGWIQRFLRRATYVGRRSEKLDGSTPLGLERSGFVLRVPGPAAGVGLTRSELRVTRSTSPRSIVWSALRPPKLDSRPKG